MTEIDRIEFAVILRSGKSDVQATCKRGDIVVGIKQADRAPRLMQRFDLTVNRLAAILDLPSPAQYHVPRPHSV